MIIKGNSKVVKLIILLVSFIAVLIMFNLNPIAQNPYYFEFADERTILSIPNFFNVMSNIFFLFVGLYGLFLINCTQKIIMVESVRKAYQCFFIGVALVAFGSAYFHYNPSNITLIWDRLPMSLSFMALLSITFAEFLSVKWAKISFMPLLMVGLVSVLSWYFSEMRQQGDLRLYILVQFLPIILICILLLLGQNIFNHALGYWGLFFSYIAAKLTEYWDLEIYHLLGNYISGHTLKHILAALGLYFLLWAFKQRMRIGN